MSGNVIKICQKADKTREVVFTQRDDGLFEFYERLGDGDQTEYETHPEFVPYPHMVDTASIFGTLDEAMNSAASAVVWFNESNED